MVPDVITPVDVLYLTHNYPRYSGDFAGQFVARLAELTTRRGLRAAVLAPHHPGASFEEVMQGVLVQRFPYGTEEQETLMYRGDLGKLTLAGPRSMGAHWRFFRSFGRAAREAVEQFNPACIHAHWWIPAGWIARRLNFRGPLIVTLHGTDLRLLRTKAWLRPLAARVFSRARIVTVVSSWLGDSLREMFPALDSKLRIVPMPPNDDAFVPSPSRGSGRDAPVILSVTRFTEQKRNHVLIDALRLLKDQGSMFTARLIGEGPLEPAVRAQARTLGVDSCVEFVPSMPQERLASEYQSADVVVLPAVDEGFGMVLVEAQLCGATVIGARSGGLVDIVKDGQTGLLVAPESASELATALGHLLADKGYRDRLATAGLASARQRFSSDAIADQFCRWYRGEM